MGRRAEAVASGQRAAAATSALWVVGKWAMQSGPARRRRLGATLPNPTTLIRSHQVAAVRVAVYIGGSNSHRRSSKITIFPRPSHQLLLQSPPRALPRSVLLLPPPEHRRTSSNHGELPSAPLLCSLWPGRRAAADEHCRLTPTLISCPTLPL